MKNKFFIIFVLCTSLILSGCNTDKAKYSPNLYTKEETLSLYYENEKLFNDVVEVIINEPQFWEKCRGKKGGSSAFISSPYDDERMQVFNFKDKQIILDFFELKPYMISHSDYKCSVTITFINENQDDARSFMYWIDPHFMQYNGFKYVNALDQELVSLRQDYIVETLSERQWYFYYYDSSSSGQDN